MKIRWVGYLARMREGRRAYRVSLGKPEGKKKTLGRPDIYVRNVLELMLKKSVVGVYWIELAEDTENSCN
jgi:hypothetical protein